MKTCSFICRCRRLQTYHQAFAIATQGVVASKQTSHLSQSALLNPFPRSPACDPYICTLRPEQEDLGLAHHNAPRRGYWMFCESLPNISRDASSDRRGQVAIVTSRSPIHTRTPLPFTYKGCDLSLTNEQSVVSIYSLAYMLILSRI